MTLSFSLSGTYLDGMYSQFVVNIRMDNAVWLKNPNTKIRNSKQTQNSNLQTFKTSGFNRQN
jgi:hypothetical protein